MLEIEHLQKGEYPEPVEYSARTKEHGTLFSERVWNGVYQRGYSPDFDCFGYRSFTIYLHVISNVQGAHRIDFMPQFADYGEGPWCDFPQGLFAALGYSDAVAPVNIHHCFTGPCAGRLFRLRVIGTTVSAQAYFTATARVEFWS